MNDDSKLDQLFQTYRAACPEVEPSTNFMPRLWQRIESRHSFGFIFQNLARTTVTVCAALCLLLVFLNFVPPFRERATDAQLYRCLDGRTQRRKHVLYGKHSWRRCGDGFSVTQPVEVRYATESIGSGGVCGAAVWRRGGGGCPGSSLLHRPRCQRQGT